MELKPRAYEKIAQLMQKGVDIPNPLSLDIGEEVKVDLISGKGVKIYPGCRIYGKQTVIASGAQLGREGPVTVEDCEIGPKVELKGGYFKKSVFLEKASMGLGAHVREACILEEEANGAHCVGLKQTILFPFVTLGSLINFCDCLMSGGTSRKNHSEIGSSYIHFNYTPHQDKATPSLIGDVPRGVMLDQAPVFLGGQGGLVGPVRIGFGSVIPAGAVFREDAPEGGHLLYPTPKAGKTKSYEAGAYRGIRRVVLNNLIYIGNIRALQAWYRFVRQLFVGDDFARACHEGAMGQLNSVIAERIKRLKELAEKMPRSLEIARAESHGAPAPWSAEQERLVKEWPAMEAALKKGPADSVGAVDRDRFLSGVGTVKGTNCLDTVRSLSPSAKQTGTAWLQAVVQEVSLVGGFHSKGDQT